MRGPGGGAGAGRTPWEWQWGVLSVTGVKARWVLRGDPAGVGWGLRALAGGRVGGSLQCRRRRKRRRKAGDDGLAGSAAAWRFPC